MPQNFLRSTWTKFELYTDDNKLKFSSNPKDILKTSTKIMRNSTIIGEDESEAIKNIITLLAHSFYCLRHNWWVK